MYVECAGFWNKIFYLQVLLNFGFHEKARKYLLGENY